MASVNGCNDPTTSRVFGQLYQQAVFLESGRCVVDQAELERGSFGNIEEAISSVGQVQYP